MSAPIAGPSLPAHLAPKPPLLAKPPAQASPDGSDSEDDFMPALPPNFQAPRSAAPIGPSLPPGFSRTDGDEMGAESEDEEEQAGPVPLPAHLASLVGQESEGVAAIREREERQREMERIERESKLLKREEWMLQPPKELDLQATIDPTKIKSRGFKQNSKPHSSIPERQSGPGSLWTETPAERLERLADEAMGKRRRAEDVAKDNNKEEDLEQAKRRKRDRAVREKVEQHNKSSRNASLLDMHKAEKAARSKSKAEEEEVIWDHDTMMGVSGKLMGEKQKAEMIRDARGLGGRFGGGSFL